jgi:protein arginine kinase activator
MLCQICNKNPATVHLTEIQDNRTSELHVCQSCAQEKGLAPQVNPKNFSVSELVAKMFDDMATGEEEKIGPVQCPHCGMQYTAFKDTGRLGCAECYTTFQAKLRPLLRRIHGSTRHTGKHPSADGEAVARTRQVQRLQDELQRAIDREDFERAAELRDQIRTLETAAARPGNPAAGRG